MKATKKSQPKNIRQENNTVEVKQTDGFNRGSFANQQNLHLSTSIRFADAKAGALIAVSGLVLPETIYLLNSDYLLQKICYISALVLLIIGIFLSFIVVLPTSKNSKMKGIIYWENITNYSEEEFIHTIKTMNTSRYLDAWLQNNYIQAKILTRKFKLLSYSFKICILSFSLILVSAILPEIISLWGKF